MGTEVYIHGSIQIAPRLEERHADYLTRFNRTRRMKRNVRVLTKMEEVDSTHAAVGLPLGLEGGYYVGDDEDWRCPSIVDANRPPRGQPRLWCPWMPTHDLSGLTVSNDVSNDDFPTWLRYVIKHFLAPWGYTVSGLLVWDNPSRGRYQPSCMKLVVHNNRSRASKSGAWRANSLPLMKSPLDL